jgi:hypothetical protein
MFDDLKDLLLPDLDKLAKSSDGPSELSFGTLRGEEVLSIETGAILLLLRSSNRGESETELTVTLLSDEISSAALKVTVNLR